MSSMLRNHQMFPQLLCGLCSSHACSGQRSNTLWKELFLQDWYPHFHSPAQKAFGCCSNFEDHNRDFSIRWQWKTMPVLWCWVWALWMFVYLFLFTIFLIPQFLVIPLYFLEFNAISVPNLIRLSVAFLYESSKFCEDSIYHTPMHILILISYLQTLHYHFVT